MRKDVIGLTMIALVAGCRAEAPPAGGAAGYDRTVAALGGQYVWNCRLTGETGAAPWRFALQKRGGGRWKEVFLVEAGQPRAQPVEVKEDGAARIYTLRDETEMLIASDGEVWAEGPGGSRGKSYTTGRCSKGEQPA